MLKKITKWETEDGKVFDTQEEAEEYMFEQERGVPAQEVTKVQQTAPKVIYLNIGPDAEDYDFKDLLDVTWCDHDATYGSIQYVRADLAATKSVAQDVEKLREELAEEIEATNNWRRLALQFDNHRMQALWHLKRILHADSSVDDYKAAEAFIVAPPLDGEAVLAQRIAELTAAHPPEAAPVELPAPAAWMLGCQTMGGNVGWKLSWSQSGAGVCHRLSGEEFEHPLYTEQQVIDLLKSVGVSVKEE